MLQLNVILDGDGAWPDLLRRQVVHAEEGAPIHVLGLKGGMQGGGAAVVIRIDLPNDHTVIAQTSLRLFLAAARGLAARYGEE